MTMPNEERLDILTQESKKIVNAVMDSLASLQAVHNLKNEEAIAVFSGTIVYLLKSFSECMPKDVRKIWIHKMEDRIKEEIDLEKE